MVEYRLSSIGGEDRIAAQLMSHSNFLFWSKAVHKIYWMIKG